MPLLSALAVVLCVAMVLIVWSVMSGFLDMLLASGRTLIGDVVISWPVRGIPYYDDLIDDLEADDAISAAAPVIEAPGLIKLPDGSVRMITVVGVDGPSYDAVTDFGDSLWWQPLAKALPRDVEEEDLRLKMDEKYFRDGLTMTERDSAIGRERPAAVLGIEVSGYNYREAGGWIVPRYRFMPNDDVTISVLPLSEGGAVVDVQARVFPVANEFRTGLFEIDNQQALVRLDALQEMLRMNGAERIDEAFQFGAVRRDDSGRESFGEPQVVGRVPARATSVLVRASEGFTPAMVQERAFEIYADFASRVEEAPEAGLVPIYTWEERPGVRTLVAAVKKETALVLVLFIFISLTAVFLVFAIFWAMVTDKTRDIGILRAMGASRRGVAWIFLRYGVAIGVVGSLLGGALAYSIVWNINPIHEWLGTTLGIYVWDPSIYYFSEIPSEVRTSRAVIVLAGGVIFSVLGALIPAIKAANMDPVRALRFE
jgi:lipoprotein-releasing system permease protein